VSGIGIVCSSNVTAKPNSSTVKGAREIVEQIEPMLRPHSAGDQLATEITLLESPGTEQLRARWKVLYGTEAPPRTSRDLLARALAYRIQERVLGGLSASTRRVLERAAVSRALPGEIPCRWFRTETRGDRVTAMRTREFIASRIRTPSVSRADWPLRRKVSMSSAIRSPTFSPARARSLTSRSPRMAPSLVEPLKVYVRCMSPASSACPLRSHYSRCAPVGQSRFT
jgi:hypothetical protein